MQEGEKDLETNVSPQSVIVVSGGTASNEIVSSFTGLFPVCRWVIPVSDNGGSSSEIIRVLGGPSLGDIRSRLVRLIPDTPDKRGLRDLFSYRLPSDEDGTRVKQEWLDIVEGSHPLWRSIPTDRREAIRAFLVHFEHACLRRAQRRFNYRSGSIGNFWLAGAQLFVRSLQSAIFLFSSVCGISTDYSVIPAINTNSLVTIAAELADGSRIVGQNEISHPSEDQIAGEEALAGSYTPATPLPWNDQVSGHSSQQARDPRRNSLGHLKLPHSHLAPASTSHSASSSRPVSRAQHTPAVHSPLYSHSRTSSNDIDDDDNLSVIARTAFDMNQQDVDEGETSWDTNRTDRRRSQPAGNIVFSKDDDGSWRSLPSPISRIIYLNTYGQETFPAPSSAFLNGLATSEVLVYSCGSLYTSLIPPLALTGVGSAIAMSSKLKVKVLLLNATFDRESEGLTAVDFVQAVTDHLNGGIASLPLSHQQSQPSPSRKMHAFSPCDYVTHLVYLENGKIPVDLDKFQAMNIACVSIPDERFEDANLKTALKTILAA